MKRRRQKTASDLIDRFLEDDSGDDSKTKAKRAIDKDLSTRQIQSHKTGQKCPRSGMYRSQCKHKELIPLSLDERFPPCKKGNHSVQWTFVKDAGPQ